MTTADTAPEIDFGSGITATATGLFFADAVPYEVWEALGKRLLLNGRAHQWWLGDWLNEGEKVYGETYTQAIDETGYEYQTLANMAWVASQFGVSRRRENVPWSLHADAAGLEDTLADELLAEAAEGREQEPDQWTRVSFRARVRNLKNGRHRDAGLFTGEEPSAAEQAALARGDRCEVMTLEDNSWPGDAVDLLLTSPPYGTGQDYDSGGDYDDWDEYLDMMAKWATGMVRLLNPRHGRICVNVPIDKSANAGQRGRPAYEGRAVLAAWTQALLTAGMSYRSTLLWYDRDAGEGTQRGSVDSPAAPHVVAPAEAIIVGFRGTWSRSSERAHDLSHQEWLDELGPRGVWEIPGIHDSRHPTAWPPELPERLVRLFSFRGDTVCDPMCGVGTAGVAGARLGRRVWLADRSPKYVELARQAVAEARGAEEPEEGAA